MLWGDGVRFSGPRRCPEGDPAAPRRTLVWLGLRSKAPEGQNVALLISGSLAGPMESPVSVSCGRSIVRARALTALVAGLAFVIRQVGTHRRQSLLAAVGLVLLGFPAIGVASGEESSPVRRFVLRPHTHGIFLEDARRLGAESFPELAAILREEAARPYWINAAVVMGLVGHPAALDTLNDLAWERFNGPVDAVTFAAMTGWPSALAAGSGPGAQRIFQFLSHGTNPAYWDSLPWSYRPMSRRHRNEYMSRLYTVALGRLPGAEVERLLRRLEQKPYFSAQRADARAALKANADVTKMGIERYLQQQQFRHTARAGRAAR